MNFGRHKVSVRYLLKQDLEKVPKLQQQLELCSASRSTLCFMKAEDIIIFLEQKSNINIKKNTDKFNKPELPDIVAAWFSILYDILMLVDRPAILDPIKIEARYIMASHEMATIKGCDEGGQKECWWPAPLWNTFYAHDVFLKQWDKFYEDLLKFNFLNLCKKQDYDTVGVTDLNTRLIVASWIECVLKVFAALNRSFIEDSNQTGEQPPPENNKSELDKVTADKQTENVENLRAVFASIELLPTFSRDKSNDFSISNPEKTKKIAEAFETKVIEAAHKLYNAINYRELKPILIEKDAMKEWLEKKLPLLFSYFYVPLGNTEQEAISHCNVMILKEPKLSELTQYWNENASFFLADLDNELQSLFPRKKILKTIDPDKKLSSDVSYNAYINTLGSFGALHQFWKTEDLRDKG